MPKYDLPSKEERSGSYAGVGSLPGPKHEVGVVVLPEERKRRMSNEIHPALFMPSTEDQMPSSVGGVGTLPGRRSERGVALLPEERLFPADEILNSHLPPRMDQLPSREHLSGSVVGVGSLPGKRGEQGVVLLPEERLHPAGAYRLPVPSTHFHASSLLPRKYKILNSHLPPRMDQMPSRERVSGSIVGVGSLPGQRTEKGVALTPEERHNPADQILMRKDRSRHQQQQGSPGRGGHGKSRRRSEASTTTNTGEGQPREPPPMPGPSAPEGTKPGGEGKGKRKRDEREDIPEFPDLLPHDEDPFYRWPFEPDVPPHRYAFVAHYMSTVLWVFIRAHLEVLHKYDKDFLPNLLKASDPAVYKEGWKQWLLPLIIVPIATLASTIMAATELGSPNPTGKEVVDCGAAELVFHSEIDRQRRAIAAFSDKANGYSRECKLVVDRLRKTVMMVIAANSKGGDLTERLKTFYRTNSLSTVAPPRHIRALSSNVIRMALHDNAPFYVYDINIVARVLKWNAKR
ncbi:hypothetical protein NMY22_g19674 [Coprinellus aureogranulatus]|nr:hypothetical protein NMY22_g19674 [Coprinellus aureogranulatus]